MANVYIVKICSWNYDGEMEEILAAYAQEFPALEHFEHLKSKDNELRERYTYGPSAWFPSGFRWTNYKNSYGNGKSLEILTCPLLDEFVIPTE